MNFIILLWSAYNLKNHFDLLHRTSFSSFVFGKIYLSTCQLQTCLTTSQTSTSLFSHMTVATALLCCKVAHNHRPIPRFAFSTEDSGVWSFVTRSTAREPTSCPGSQSESLQRCLKRPWPMTHHAESAKRGGGEGRAPLTYLPQILRGG